VLAGLSPARRRVVLALLAVVTVAVVALAVVLLLPGGGRGGEPVSQERPGPVLLVPGYGGSTEALQALADRLTAVGRDATVVALPGDGTGDLRASADALGAAATAVLARTGAASVDVVGYSAGGVIARLWVADGGGSEVRRVVTLGSPQHGTGLADLAGDVAPDQCPEGCQQLATDSELLAQLNAQDETPDGPTWISIWTTQDETVTPPDSARLDGALNITVQSVCANARVGHGGLPRDPLVQAMVVTELGAGDPVHLTSADCARLGGS
jgi:triacylglycerol esterase/lipase EstA (alpha/beta hydrolase family)